MKAKFFGLFRVFYLVEKQAYKLKLPEKWRIYNIFYMSLLKQDTTRKKRIDKNNANKLDACDNKGGEYKVEAIWDSAIYARESTEHLLGLYYLVFWKDYLKEENT